MREAVDHEASVDAWIGTCLVGLRSQAVLDRFEEAFGCVWRRAYQTLGEVTLVAILDRVRADVSAAYPTLDALNTITVSSEGLDCVALRARANEIPPPLLESAIRLLFTQFLTVLGRLTADILSASLHAELSAAAHRQRDTATPRPSEHRESDEGVGS